MEEEKVAENSHLTSAAAFVEGGIQEACDDACSICLEAFCDSDPSTVTSCKHEFHLQCILEWCQRSLQCPMCWQPISLKDPNSQELLNAVEHERNMRMNPPRNTTVFHHPTLGDFELQHLPVNASESGLEERILQHLAAAAAMGRARHIARRVHRNRPSAQGRSPQFVVFSTNPNGPSATSSDSQLITIGEDPGQLITGVSNVRGDQVMSNEFRSSAGTSSNWSTAHTSPSTQERAGPSDLNSFSESLKSRLSALSTRYKESITKSTRGWKERLFSRNSSSPEPSIDVHGEANQVANTNQNIATVSRMMDHLSIAEDDMTNNTQSSDNSGNSVIPGAAERPAEERDNNHLLNERDAQTPSTAGSTSS